MIRTRMSAVATTALALIAPAAVVALSSSAEAGSAKRHSVKMYKVEGWVEVLGEFPDNDVDATLACDPGDRAMDGTWKIDSYETPNADDDVWGDTRSVRATESRADGALPNQWNFNFVNEDTGRATLKTFVTCLETTTGSNAGHTHPIDVSAKGTESPAAFAVPGSVTYTFVDPCVAGQFPVAPGFRVSAGAATLTASEPSGLGSPTWTWTFDVPVSATIHFYLACVTDKVLPNDGHAHTLDLEWTTPTTTALATSSREIVTESGAPKDFALVGGFDVLDPSTTHYLGQDARGRKRDFVFWSDSADSVETSVLTLRKRTSRQIAP